MIHNDRLMRQVNGFAEGARLSMVRRADGIALVRPEAVFEARRPELQEIRSSACCGNSAQSTLETNSSTSPEGLMMTPIRFA